MVWVMSPKQPWWSIWISTAAWFRPSRVVEYSCYSQSFLQFRFIELMQTLRFKRWILCEDIAPKVCMSCPNICWLFRPFTKMFNLSEDASRSNSHLTMISDPTPSWFCAIVKPRGTFWPCFCPCTVKQQNSSKDHMKLRDIYNIVSCVSIKS